MLPKASTTTQALLFVAILPTKDIVFQQGVYRKVVVREMAIFIVAGIDCETVSERYWSVLRLGMTTWLWDRACYALQNKFLVSSRLLTSVFAASYSSYF
jgi:hypothetical protein